MPDPVGFDRLDPASYSRWSEVTLRFNDQDSMGHINNTSYAAFVEVARTTFFQEIFERRKDPTIDFVLAHLGIDYLRETRFPGVIHVGLRLTRLGNKSLGTAYGMFKDDTCVATADCVNVFFNTETRSSAPCPEEVRAFLEAELIA